MLNLFPRPPLDNSNSESPEEHTSFNLCFKAKAIINIEGKVLLLLLGVGGSVFGGGLFYSISNNLLPSNTEAGNDPSHTELVDQSSK